MSEAEKKLTRIHELLNQLEIELHEARRILKGENP